ncbi:MAG: Lyso-phosphatidylcholine acyltransferase [Ramalina farinacea]|uniref:Tafazzin family protein n=1 Tax=Ramalina farinacea TaxID=258253 RepID=A0AA43QM77_9LECA|nr:Lyso-phosphatidylcholine acyltransferase [Ramalina farinacea]
MADSDEPLPPSLPWRIGSVIVMGGIGTLVRTFMNIPNTQRAHGLDRFLDLVDDREDVGKRKRGLITAPTHTLHLRRMDDPFIWGVLPLRYHFNPSNHRWSLASYDICFNKGRFASHPLSSHRPPHPAQATS